MTASPERVKRVILGVALLAAIGAVLLWRLPTAAGCRASGRTVDPTNRHCIDGSGYVQLREHVIMHTAEVLLLLAVVAAVFFGILVWRRRSS